jgi:hypothetical protein
MDQRAHVKEICDQIGTEVRLRSLLARVKLGFEGYFNFDSG